jgi:hypothetical protein
VSIKTGPPGRLALAAPQSIELTDGRTDVHTSVTCGMYNNQSMLPSPLLNIFLPLAPICDETSVILQRIHWWVREFLAASKEFIHCHQYGGLALADIA